ncbi:MAG: SPOR domain-containing protein [Gallionella sp.]
MRLLFLLLLLANLAFFAANEFELGWGENAQRVQLPLHPELIQLRDTAKSGQGVLPAISKPNSLAKLSSDPSLKMSTSVSPKQSQLICMEWGDFSGDDLKKVTTELSKLKLGDKLGERQIEQDTGFWVYMPPLKSKARVRKKVRELKDLGVYEYYVIAGKGKWKNAISLGIFKTRAAAQKLYKKLKAQGVRSAKMGERASKLISTQFLLNGIHLEIKDKLIGLQKDFNGSELNDVPCTLTK